MGGRGIHPTQDFLSSGEQSSPTAKTARSRVSPTSLFWCGLHHCWIHHKKIFLNHPTEGRGGEWCTAMTNLGCVVDDGIQQFTPLTHLEEVTSGLESLRHEPSSQGLVEENSGEQQNNFHPLVIRTFDCSSIPFTTSARPVRNPLRCFHVRVVCKEGVRLHGRTTQQSENEVAQLDAPFPSTTVAPKDRGIVPALDTQDRQHIFSVATKEAVINSNFWQLSTLS